MFWNFLAEFIGVFAKGFIGLFVSTDTGYGGLLGGLYQMFNVPQYMAVINKYSGDFGIGEWIGFGAIVLVFIAILVAIIVFIVKLFIKLFSRLSNQSMDGSLLDEVERLDKELKRKDKQIALMAQGKNIPVVSVGCGGYA